MRLHEALLQDVRTHPPTASVCCGFDGCSPQRCTALPAACSPHQAEPNRLGCKHGAQVTSRAFSWPMNPAATGSASPASLRPRPLTCECDAMRSVLVVDLTSSIFILHVTTESATQTVRQSLSGTRLRPLRLRARGHGCRRREEGTRSLDSAPCRSMAPETAARGNDACIHAKMGRVLQRNSSRGGEPPPRTFQRRRPATEDLENTNALPLSCAGKVRRRNKKDVGPSTTTTLRSASSSRTETGATE